ncbi:hypothetical protein LJC58_08880 [Lachnospiraceae bacterium OttesenSCG-928-D06]|nr:hypothetical protein [Lachnospiraceae bacterium OttesenSCG-928-D06]
MIQELKTLCRKRGLKTCLLFLGVFAVCIYLMRTEIRLILIFRSMEYIEKKDTFYFVSIFALVMLLFVLWNLFDMITGRCVKSILDFPKKYPEYSLDDIERDFSNATVYENYFFSGNQFLIYVTGGNARILALKDIVWAYYKETTKNYATTRFLVLQTYDKKYYEITLKKAQTIEDILEHFRTNNLSIVTGYNNDLKKLYKKNPGEFSNLVLGSKNNTL